MVSSYWLIVLLAGIFTVWSYPMDGELLYEDGFYISPTESRLYNSLSIPDARPIFEKRSHLASKRATLNQLLQKLVAMYGNDDIQYSGRPSHVRFALGGRKR